MPVFKVIEGGLSTNYNKFNDYSFVSCTATDTRLMGVVALRSTWLSNDIHGKTLSVLMHLDFSEYGIDDYREFTHTTAKIASRDTDLQGYWEEISGNLGGSMVEITLPAMMYLIDSAVAINEKYYRGHEQDIIDFRKDMMRKVAQLHEACDDIIADETASEREYMQLVCPKNLKTYETINYFLMRLIDKDTAGASYMSDMDPDQLENNPLAKHGLMSLIRNRINLKDSGYGKDAETYRCSALTLNESGYYYSEIDLTLSGRTRDRNRLITDMSFSSCMKITEFEAAMQLRQSEYITVYSIGGDPEEFDLSHSLLASRAAVSEVPNGVLYVLYNLDNNHVNTNNYYLNRDLYGAYIVTPQGELVIMSAEISKITNMEMDLQTIILLDNLELVGRYHFTSQVFQTFASTPGAVFDDVIYRPEDE